MPLWDKVKQELDRAGKVAQEALDEGRIRVEAFRARQMADKAAEALGYAVHRARTAGAGADQTEVDRLHAELAAHEAEAARLEAELAVITRRTPRPAGEESTSGAATGVATGVATVETPASTDFGGNSGASHQPDGSVYTGGAESGSAGGSTGTSEGAAGGSSAPGAPPGERNEWNREHL